MAPVTTIACTESDVRAAAGDRTFERGIQYLPAVDRLAIVGNQVTATIQGSEEYHVVLSLQAEATGRGRIRGECSCPQGHAGFFCKHCVAVALTAAGRAAVVPAQRSGGPTGAPAGNDLDSWLDSQNREDLHLLIIEHLVQDADFRRYLRLRASVPAADVPEILSLLTDMLGGPDPGSGPGPGSGSWPRHEEIEPGRYARTIRDAVSAVGSLIGAGHASAATIVAEHAIGLVARSSPAIRDEAGVIGTAAAELIASHHRACEMAPPDPVRLADFVAARTADGRRAPGLDFADYLDLLGTAGVARLRERLTEAWQTATQADLAAQPDPAAQAGTAAKTSPSARAGPAAQQVLERLLRLTGDTDALVAVISGGADVPDGRHLRIAQELVQAGRPDEALTFAEHGLREAEADRPDQRLADFVAGRYRALGRNGDALTVRRDRFTAGRDLARFARLREDAKRAGDWPATRQWALRLLRADAEARSWPGVPGSFRRPPEPVLIDVLIDEGDPAEAWESAAGIASEAQWLRLADLVAETRPADALSVYLRQIEPLRAETGERVYQRVVRLLISARECHQALGTEAAFVVYLQALREEQKRKRMLISMLDKRQLP